MIRADFQFYIESQATDLIQLAYALVVDLGLEKAPNVLGVARLSFISDAIRKIKGPRREGHTLDDMRAMLGFSYLYSMYVISDSTYLSSFSVCVFPHFLPRAN